MTAPLTRFPLLANLAPEERRTIAERLHPFAAPAGAVLARQGEPPDHLLLIEEGEVALTARAPHGEAVRLGTLRAGDLLPGAFLDEDPPPDVAVREMTATATAPVQAWRMGRSDLVALQVAAPAAALGLVRAIAQALSDDIRAWNLLLTGPPAPQDQAGCSPHPAGQPIPPSAQWRGFLSLLPFFQGFDEVDLDLLLRHLAQWELPRDFVVVTEGQETTSAFIIVRGAVEAAVQRGERRHRLSVVGPGKMFGQLALISEGRASASCVVRERAVLLEMSRESLALLAQANIRLALRFVTAVATDLSAIHGRAARRTAQGGGVSPTLPVGEPLRASRSPQWEQASRDALIERIQQSIIGEGVVIHTPFGARRVVYADYTASGRCLSFLEDFLRHEVMPLYANTHTMSSGTGAQTTRLREDARQIIHEAVGGGPDDLVLFCGSGATGAIDKLVRILGLSLPKELDQAWGLSSHIPAERRPVVFIGPYEHHSNELPWRESIADVVTIPEDEDGHPCLKNLERELVRYADRPLKIGSFSAASNVTGILTDTSAVASLLHRHGALSFWDYAAAGPYLAIEMHPAGDPLAYKDAIFLSPHKFPGGPGTPGVLVVQRGLLQNAVPSVPGGGTVAWVAPWAHRYIDDPIHREEGGTPAILESIRAGLVFQLKGAVGAETIHARERDFVTRAIASWRQNPNLWVLGNPDVERLSIVSMVARKDGRYLHWNYIVALLNDLFGIQARGGCSCAGPYGHKLFNIGREASAAFAAEVERGCESIKPGWFRVGFNYFFSETTFQYIVDAVHLVANEGWRLLPQYTMDPYTALWQHRSGRGREPFRLHELRYKMGQLEHSHPTATEPESALPGYLEAARTLFAEAAAQPTGPVTDPQVSADYEDLRWFWTPSEALAALSNP